MALCCAGPLAVLLRVQHLYRARVVHIGHASSSHVSYFHVVGNSCCDARTAVENFTGGVLTIFHSSCSGHSPSTLFCSLYSPTVHSLHARDTRYAEGRLQEESDRADQCLHVTTRKPLIAAIECVAPV